MQPQTFVFFGIIGSGKGTQVKLLTEFLKTQSGRETVYAGTGEEFRKLAQSDTHTSQIVKELMVRGELIPDFLTNALFTNILISELNPEKNLIADGYPRTLAQAESFEKKMKFYGRNNIDIIYIEVDKEEALKRNLLRGRPDDTKEGIEKRFELYARDVIPAMDYFKDKSGYTTHVINGEQSVEDVHKDIIKSLGY